MHYKVKEVADIVGVSVRTLHHYDQIGLLKPASLTPAGYRLYTEDDLLTLQQILFFKELDFSLEEIKSILYSLDFDRKRALIVHKELLVEKKKRLEKIIQSVDKTINSFEGGIEMNKDEMFGAFDMTEMEKFKDKYAEEVREKYDKKVVDECEKRTSSYTKKDWTLIQKEGDEIYIKIASLMDKGPENNQIQEEIERFRNYINTNFYKCTIEIFRGLGDLYVSDQRFTENIDKYKSGLAKFLREAMNIYCDKLEK